MSKDYPNARDCPHGRQWGKCDTCDMLEALAELNTLRAENERLKRIEAAVADQAITDCGDRHTPGACSRCPCKVCAALAEGGRP